MSARLPKNYSLGIFLQQQRLKKGMSQGDVAKELGYSTNQFVSNWERGLCAPPLDSLAKLTTLCDINRDELMQVMMEDAKRQIEKKLSFESEL